ncbi:MAG: Uma2 family endonuclease [Caldilineaceae bacterium]
MVTAATLDYAVIDDPEYNEPEDFQEVSSFNHGYIQARLGILFDRLTDYTPVNEVSLDVSRVDLSQFDLRTREEIKPDVCLYPKRGLSSPKDILRMTEMPLLAVEILSPKQGLYEIVEKFRLYFALGVRSCWLVEPMLRNVTVYRASDEWQTFTADTVIDDVLNLNIPLAEIFA